MQSMPMNPSVGQYFLRRYSGVRQEGLHAMWYVSCSWVEERVSPHYFLNGRKPPAIFEAAAIMRMHTISCDPAQKQAFLFAATELLLPYA